MKENIFTQIINTWNFLSPSEKIELLQKFEELNARFEDRNAREIVLSKDRMVIPNTKALYTFKEPKIIKLYGIDSNPMGMIDSIFHEGFHALCDDFFHDKTDLKTFSKVDKDRLYDERSKIDIIHNRAFNEGALTLFSLSYYEEKLIRKETCLYLIYNLLQSCQGIGDIQMLIGTYHSSVLGQYYSYEEYLKKVNGYDSDLYSDLLKRVDEIDMQLFKDKIIDVGEHKKEIIHYPQASILVPVFDKGLKLLKDFQSGQISQEKYIKEQLTILEEGRQQLQ